METPIFLGFGVVGSLGKTAASKRALHVVVACVPDKKELLYSSPLLNPKL